MRYPCTSIALAALVSMVAGCGEGVQTMSHSKVTIGGVTQCKLKVRNKSFDEVIRFFKKEIDAPISIGGNVDTARKVTGTFKGKSWDIALEELCGHLGYAVERETDESGNVIRIRVSPKRQRIEKRWI